MRRYALTVALKLFIALLFIPFAYAGKVSIANYNVENLFDTEHDEGKNDFPYLPQNHPLKEAGCRANNNGFRLVQCLEQDWTHDKLKIKLDQIKKVFDSMPRMPEIIALTEVENRKVVEMLADHLGAGHQTYITHSPDKRGVEVALIVKKSEHFKVIKTKTHRLSSDYLDKNPTRDILEVWFDFEGTKLVIFVNHWPSQGNPDEARMTAANKLKEAMLEAKSNGAHAIIATGDFNVVDSNIENGINKLLTKTNGQNFNLLDLHSTFMQDQSIHFSLKRALPMGSYFFGPGMQWNMLDRFIVNDDLLNPRSRVKIDLKTYQIHSPMFITTDYEYNDDRMPQFGSIIKATPWRYDHNANRASEAGFSDHFPIYTELTVKEK
jgi:endonuclease/exonuclease/phosphatase family metal-dependent hydrolase